MNTERNEGFDKFWKEWPGRDAKKAAWTAWARISPTLYPVLMAALEKQKKHKAWLKSNGKFVPSFPYASTWLNGKRWEDEISLPEDKDAEILIEALAAHASAPAGFPKHIMERFRVMCGRQRVNWPALHCQLGKDEDVGEKIKKDYLDADNS